MSRADNLALPACRAFIKIFNKLFDICITHLAVAEYRGKQSFHGFTHSVALHDLGKKALLGSGDFQKINHLSPGDNAFFCILVIHRTPQKTFSASRAGIKLDQSPHIQLVNGDISGLFLFYLILFLSYRNIFIFIGHDAISVKNIKSYS